ncbi:GDSL family lipase [Aeromicrobium sp. A1-2]|uniref:SGNH/GDSL hydrolase family protein n=1 Tax=Aeromicrobium sp. A1-2 TaxID=2107713 RepID=UPI000E5317E9|nr:SGNH/GDSL hydrolase family protein [Aeromicrobium sp. A1-2]AXT85218.1 GDSL family lipase [Aeromicrobium sp. A1-2]
MAPRLGVASLLVVLSLTGCQASSEDGLTVGSVRSYVAMGDSFVSGPGILPHDPDGGACLRSDRDYPSLLAKELRVAEFTDVSCGGATTDHLIGPAQTASGLLPAQLDALSADTTLVTVGIGGNDGNFYEGLFNSCVFPAYRTDSGCTYFAETQSESILATTKTKVTRALQAIQEAAPRAKVVLVGYLRIVPDSGACESMTMGAEQIAEAASVTRDVDRMQRDAARDAGMTYISLRALSAGHDACAGDAAWVNGLTSTATDGIYLHPRSAGMRAAAAHLADRLTSR